ncbi:undecaprenyl-phosphate glucose phosphotransferase [Algibacter amylolyticus]|uniref:Undecaprenyl-phosphate glucose phosphotransferase n=1 Tax=Algibacter amylolyticus TaxID=1608400 RepID=A0A5M7BIQ8_9FLAO|nr:undecaprenyl-phosphate glucose phosphotransferase [Algibacter amylolyticus]KAA5827411.1 undecaprenyl-phosphate glucose phosphotransferase [Algibacter amylolyticus]MBB5266603.1 putative colanic acid biosynthesis UDP-glucose lipid carrier transferase [Algibacter amylolyticus]TSJ81656.1 undecaprenyl-phosphate glucose phosphotransferase [Algibacter amylolyticus]
MNYKKGRYSSLIKPLFGFIDLVIINAAVFYFDINLKNIYIFCLYISLSWMIIAIKNHFYEVQRHTRLIQIIPLLFKQIILFTIVLYAFIGFFKQPNVSRFALGNYLLLVFLLIFIFKFLTTFLLKKYRTVLRGNNRKVIVIGCNDKARQLIKTFNTRLDYGYKFEAQFSIKDKEFSLDNCFNYIIENNIDEIYFSVSELSNKQINRLIDFADNNLRELKFIPDNKEIYSKKLKYEYYDYIPILSIRAIPLQEPFSKLVKRLFDIVFSLFIIVFVLSWLTPIIALLIKLESKGPVFFKQSRNGFNYKEFDCYKFRSMTPNKDANLHQATKGDLRVTKMGAFIRKTSIDELPQFFNVLFGDMSVVGPRPHMVSHTNMYAQRIDKFMVRHFVKPGITGLAQVSGFRGEIETDKDIINRVKYDIFYIENWSLLLDIKIAIQTFTNAVKGEEKAY